LTVEAWGGGPGLVEAETTAARKRGVEVRYGSRATRLLHDGFKVYGVQVKEQGRLYELRAPSVILAAGGFQGDAEMRTRYLGPGWELAKVRGTRFNTGDGIKMALEVGASPFGNWSGCHAVQWDFNAPEYGDLAVGDAFQKHSYPWSVLINANGRRFLDEGADFRNYTYAKYGRVVLEQPGNFAWQVFDKKVAHVLRDEYRIRQVTKVKADTLEELAGSWRRGRRRLPRRDPRYNAAVRTDIPFNPNVKDGRGTDGLAVNKSNWANTIDEPPFEAYQVGCGITFTFGGLRIDTEARVLDADQAPIPGLYACGELVGGIFYFNYPGGSGLINGAVFGRLAGTTAAADMRSNAAAAWTRPWRRRSRKGARGPSLRLHARGLHYRPPFFELGADEGVRVGGAGPDRHAGQFVQARFHGGQGHGLAAGVGKAREHLRRGAPRREQAGPGPHGVVRHPLLGDGRQIGADRDPFGAAHTEQPDLPRFQGRQERRQVQEGDGDRVGQEVGDHRPAPRSRAHARGPSR
jgi:tricarballylate dehydrogenase